MDDDLRIKRGERIKEIRQQRGMNKSEFSKKIGLSYKFFCEIEAGKKSFSVDTLCEISKGLEVSADHILELEDSNLKDKNNWVELDEELMDIFYSIKENQRKEFLKAIKVIIEKPYYRKNG